MRNRYREYHPRGAMVDGVLVSKHPLYHTHSNMLSRCLSKTDAAFRNYGGRGITVCERWLSFANFVADMGPKPTPFHTLERIDNDGPYSPENCRWDTRTSQSINRRRFETNTSGETGVVQIGKKFEARFDYQGKRYNLGRYKTLEEAATIRSAFVQGFVAATEFHRG